MEIKYLGNDSFRVKGRGAILTLGLSDKNTESGLAVTAKDQKDFFIFGPGEYEVSGVEIWGGKNNCWLVEMDSFRFCFLGLNWVEPSAKKIESLGRMDILFLVLNPGKKGVEQAVEIVKKISPAVAVFGNGQSKEFLDAIDREELRPVQKLSLKQGELPETTKIVLLEAQSDG